MCFSVPAEDYEVNPILARAMDRIFTLHADHEQNASTSHSASGIIVGREPVRLYRGWNRLPLGSGPRRRQPGMS